ncbi:MAG: ribose-phosphate pyrophosphokinase-like domain-containing protein [Chitinophagaceae bacterium]
MQSTAKIFAGTGSQQLAEQICKKYGTRLGKVNIQHFSDGEICPIFMESVRGDYVFLVQSTQAPTDNLMELLLMMRCRPQGFGL